VANGLHDPYDLEVFLQHCGEYLSTFMTWRLRNCRLGGLGVLRGIYPSF
jgi:hypothetical protein